MMKYTSTATSLPPLATETLTSTVSPAATVARFRVNASDKSAHSCRGEALLRGTGGAVEKSAALLPVSVQPAAARTSPVVLLVAGPGLPWEKSASPQPTRSTIAARCIAEHGEDPPLHPSGTVLLTSAVPT
jgi:hypothetical protein